MRPLASVLRGAYVSVIRSNMLPCPSVILAIILLPQRINQVAAPIIRSINMATIQRMILRFLDIGFFCFFPFLCFFELLGS